MRTTAKRLLLICLAFTACDVIKVPCPNGNVELIHKNPKKAYESYVKTSQVNAKAAIGALGKLDSAGLDVGLNRQVTKLRQDLDNYSSRSQDVLKAAYLAYSQSPCDTAVKSNYFAVVRSVQAGSDAIETLRRRVDTLASVGNVGGVDRDKLKSIITQFETAPK
jgi:hypothetical protein